MLVRNCAGGVVFSGDKVFLIKDENGEWILPRTTIHSGDLLSEVMLRRVRDEAGISAEIVSPAGRTNYEYFSVTRQKPICNKITWFIMKSLNEQIDSGQADDNNKSGFFNIQDAINLVSYNQYKSLLNLSYQAYKEMA